MISDMISVKQGVRRARLYVICLVPKEYPSSSLKGPRRNCSESLSVTTGPRSPRNLFSNKEKTENISSHP